MVKESAQHSYERLGVEEARLSFAGFSREDAYELGKLIREKAKANPAPLGVEIWLNGLMVFRCYPTGITRDHELWLQRKRRSVEFREMSSLRLKAMAEMNHATLADWGLDPRDYALGGGGYPIRVKDTGMIGSICVSGYPDLEDHRIVVDTLTEFIARRGG
jgi:uncharacterized protein (UPF0303 family)